MRVTLGGMSCCCWSSRDRASDHPGNNFILDVEKILQDHVWKNFQSSRSPWQRLCLRRKDYVLDVPMNYFHFEKIGEQVYPRPKATLPAPLFPGMSAGPSQRPLPSLVQGMTHISRDVTQNPLLSTNHVMALSTDFTNNTDKDQTYSFHFEKTRKASLNVTFQKGFTIGGKVSFSLGLPKAVTDSKISGETDMQLTVSKSTGEVIEETLTWTATSEIKVADHSSYTARVLLSECPVSYNFKVWTKMSMPNGGAPATVRHRRKGNRDLTSSSVGESLYTMVIEDLEQVFQGYKLVVAIQPESLEDNCRTSSIIFKTTGIVEGVRLSGQKILLDGQPLRRRSYPSSFQGPCPQAPVVYNHRDSGEVPTSDGHPEDCYLGVGGVPPLSRSGRMLALTSSSQSPPPPPPIIEEMPEDDGGVGGSEQLQASHHPPFPVVSTRGGGGGLSHAVPRITTTSPSSLASSPLSDTGSPDMSDSSKKSQTVTTV